MPSHQHSTRSWATASVAVCLVLAACTDGVQLDGKVFDWMGVSPSALEGS
jgi:hypothetical protein